MPIPTKPCRARALQNSAGFPHATYNHPATVTTDKGFRDIAREALMTGQPDASSMGSPGSWQLGRRNLRGILVLVMGCLAMAAPFFAGTLGLFLTGMLFVMCGVLEMLETFRSGDGSSMRWNYLSGEMSILAGILLLNKPELMLRAVALFLAIIFVLDGIGKGVACWRARKAGSAWIGLLVIGVVKVGLALMLVVRWPISDWPIVGIVVGIHMLTAGWSILMGRQILSSVVIVPPDQHPDIKLELPLHPVIGALNASLNSEADNRRSNDARWCWVFIIVFFAIHTGRMRVYWTPVGMIDPFTAVAGDVGMT